MRLFYGLVICLLLIALPLSIANPPISALSRDSRMESAQGESEATPKYGGTLRIGESRARPSTLNPLIGDYSLHRSMPFFNSLLTYDENCSLQPDLAESYETSEDGLNVTFHLFENVSWHDGWQFNASDVKFTLDTIRDDPNVISDYKIVCANINSTEVTSTFTVVIRLNYPLAAILRKLSYIPIIPKHIYQGIGLTNDYANEHPIGTGPFKFESWTNQTSLNATAYEQYFKGRPYLNSIFYRWDYRSSKELTAALEDNLLDMLGGGLVSGGDVDLSKIKDLQDTTGTSVVSKEAAEYWSIWLNMDNPILSSKNVRQAIAHSINKTKIIEEAFYGYAEAAKGPVPPSLQEWYNPDTTDYAFNKTLAEELLDREYPRGPDGWRFSLVIKALGRIGRYPWERNALENVTEDLISVGINASLEVADIYEFGSGNFDAFFMGWIYYVWPDELYDVFHSTGMVQYQNYHNSTLDALLEEGIGSFNETLRKIDFDRAQEIIAQDLPQIFIDYPCVFAAHNNDFHGSFLSAPPINGRLTPYFLAKIWYDSTLSGKGECPYRVRFIDDQDRITGYLNGDSFEQIPNSTYSGADSDPQVVKIRLNAGNYRVEVEGVDNGVYSVELVNLALDYKHVSIIGGTIQSGQVKHYFVSVYSNSSMKVTSARPIDIYNDGKCDIKDISRVAKLFGTNYPSKKYEPICDVMFDWKIDIRDISAVARHFGETYP